MAGIVTVIPVRSFAEGKSRLAGYLHSTERERLVRNMLQHVITAVKRSAVIDRIILVSPDPLVLASVTAEGDPDIRAIEQPAGRGGLNAAVEIGRQAAIEQGASGMLVLFGDLPLLQPDDIRSIVRRDAPLIIATDRHGAGTNALMLRLGSEAAAAFRFSYGEESRQRHLEEADRLGIDAITAISAGTAIDLDTIDDIERLRAYRRSLPAWLSELSDTFEEKSA